MTPQSLQRDDMLISQRAELKPPVSELDHARGGAHALVTLVEYGDFDCSYCQQAYPVVRAAERHFGQRLRFAFRHNPRGDLHEHAMIAAKAAEAAALQGSFWMMFDRLLRRPGALDERALIAHAVALGLDAARFAADLHSAGVLARIRQDQVSGLRSVVIGTPAFFIDGHHFLGRPDFVTFIQAIDARLNVSRASAAKPA